MNGHHHRSNRYRRRRVTVYRRPVGGTDAITMSNALPVNASPVNALPVTVWPNPGVTNCFRRFSRNGPFGTIGAETVQWLRNLHDDSSRETENQEFEGDDSSDIETLLVHGLGGESESILDKYEKRLFGACGKPCMDFYEHTKDKASVHHAKKAEYGLLSSLDKMRPCFERKNECKMADLYSGLVLFNQIANEFDVSVIKELSEAGTNIRKTALPLFPQMMNEAQVRAFGKGPPSRHRRYFTALAQNRHYLEVLEVYKSDKGGEVVDRIIAKILDEPTLDSTREEAGDKNSIDRIFEAVEGDPFVEDGIPIFRYALGIRKGFMMRVFNIFDFRAPAADFDKRQELIQNLWTLAKGDESRENAVRLLVRDFLRTRDRRGIVDKELEEKLQQLANPEEPQSNLSISSFSFAKERSEAQASVAGVLKRFIDTKFSSPVKRNYQPHCLMAAILDSAKDESEDDRSYYRAYWPMIVYARFAHQFGILKDAEYELIKGMILWGPGIQDARIKVAGEVVKKGKSGALIKQLRALQKSMPPRKSVQEQEIAEGKMIGTDYHQKRFAHYRKILARSTLARPVSTTTAPLPLVEQNKMVITPTTTDDDTAGHGPKSSQQEHDPGHGPKPPQQDGTAEHGSESHQQDDTAEHGSNPHQQAGTTGQPDGASASSALNSGSDSTDQQNLQRRSEGQQQGLPVPRLAVPIQGESASGEKPRSTPIAVEEDKSNLKGGAQVETGTSRSTSSNSGPLTSSALTSDSTDTRNLTIGESKGQEAFPERNVTRGRKQKREIGKIERSPTPHPRQTDESNVKGEADTTATGSAGGRSLTLFTQKSNSKGDASGSAGSNSGRTSSSPPPPPPPRVASGSQRESDNGIPETSKNSPPDDDGASVDLPTNRTVMKQEDSSVDTNTNKQDAPEKQQVTTGDLPLPPNRKAQRGRANKVHLRLKEVRKTKHKPVGKVSRKQVRKTKHKPLGKVTRKQARKTKHKPLGTVTRKQVRKTKHKPVGKVTRKQVRKTASRS